jgi:hypothetical protein
MNREVHVRFCERRGVRFPPATHPICASWERGDFSGSTDWVPPEIEYVIADGPSPGHWTRIAALCKGFRDFLSTWEDLRVELDEYCELDDERVSSTTAAGAPGQADSSLRRCGRGQRTCFTFAATM